jgi:hypothetical protein
MVKIRYLALSAGMHVVAARHGRATVIYLLPGLTLAERRAALGRIRSSSRMGSAPRITALALLRARAADRARTVAAGSLAAIRKHPVLLLPPLAGAAGTMLMLALTTLVALPTAPSSADASSLSGPAITVQRGEQSASAAVAAPPDLRIAAGRLPLRSLWRLGAGEDRGGSGQHGFGRDGTDPNRFDRNGAHGTGPGPGALSPTVPRRGSKPDTPSHSGAPGRLAARRRAPSTGLTASPRPQPVTSVSMPGHRRPAHRPVPSPSAVCVIAAPMIALCVPD